jgi:hypothetical protein
MKTITANKRLDEIETHLTPKEWAIRQADEMRKYPGVVPYMKALAKLPLHELPMQRPYYVFEKQAGELHPGSKPDDIRARHRRTAAQWNEFQALSVLIRDVGMTMEWRGEIIGMKAAAMLSVLILREDPDGSSSSLAELSREITALLQDFYAHRAAVELIQQQEFDGHPILFLELEAELDAMARAFEIAVATANGYLIDGAVTNGNANNQAINLESIKASAAGQCAAIIAGKWRRDASHEAIKDSGERWDQCRVEYLAKE